MPPRLLRRSLLPPFPLQRRSVAHTPLIQTVKEVETPKGPKSRKWIPYLGFAGGLLLGWNIFDEIIESNSYIPIFSSPNHAMLQMRANMTGVPSAMKGDPSFEGLNTYPANYEKRISEMLVPGALGDADAVGYQNWWHSGNSKVVGLVYLGRRTAGIPTVVHGGLIHSLINESVARLGALHTEHGGTVASLKVDYKKPTRVMQFVRIDSIVSGIEGSGDDLRATIEVKVTTSDGKKVLAQGRGVYKPDKNFHLTLA